MSEGSLYSLVVRDVSVTMDEKIIKNELMSRYNGVAKVTRLFFDDEDETPKTAVQVDFTIADVAKKILQDGNIVLGGICRRVYVLKKPTYQQYNRQYTPELFSERNLLDMFEEQKSMLTEVMNSLDNKLNNLVNPQQNKHHTTTPSVVSNHA